MHLITRRHAPTQTGPKIDDTQDRLLCRSMLDPIRAAAEQAKILVKQTEHASSRLTLETVALLCGRAVETLEKQLELGAHRKVSKVGSKPDRASPELAREPLSPDEMEWRPGELMGFG